MRLAALWFALLLITCPAAAQLQGSVSGRLLDTTQHEVLDGATVRLLRIVGKDTTTAATALTRGNNFSVGRLPLGDYLLTVSFQGYRTWWGRIRLSDRQPDIVRLRIYMQIAMAELGDVVVRDERPVRVHGDTTSYAADQFHTRPNAAVGDLLQKMPGIDILQTGTLMAQGDTVKQILVNGKRFFSNDLQVALRYLPRDMVATIEVFDDKSDQAKFTGVDDGVRIRTINIVLRKSIKAGLFGQAEAGAGGDGNETLYSGRVGLHQFHGNMMNSLIGRADNTTPVMGGTQRNLMGGINFSDQWTKRTQFSGSYQANGQKGNSSVGSYTENLIPGDSSIFKTQQSGSQNHGNGQNLNLNFETDLDSADHLTIRANGSVNSNVSSNQNTSTSIKGVTVPLNNANSTSGSSNSTTNGGGSILWGRRLGKKGRNFSVSADINATNGTGSGTNQYQNTYFNPGRPDSLASANQYYTDPNKNFSYGVAVSYTEPLSKHSSLTADYRYSFVRSRTGRATSEWDSTTHRYDVPDSLLTNLFADRYWKHSGGLRYQYGSNHLQATAGLNLQDGENQSNNLSNGTTLSQRYLNLSPLATLDFMPKGGKSIRIDYQGQTTQPPLTALQPLVNNSNPLNVIIGNPGLRQSFTHSVGVSFRTFSRKDFSHVFASVRASVTENQVTDRTTVNLATGVDTTTYSNLNGNYNLSGNFDYGFRLKHPASNVGLGLDLGDMHSVGYINGILNTSSNYTLAGNIKWTSSLPDHLDLNVSYHPAYNIAVYSAEPSQNTHYAVQNLRVDGLYYSRNGWELGSDLTYTAYSGRPVGFNPTTYVWNASLAHLFFKRQQGELKLSAHDLLDQSASVNEVITPTMKQYNYGQMLGRYYLLTFTYHFKG
ncbi:outer membrane beta-barrel protein [Dinghuibacter silviterrae]|uniref:Carboxypeptidase family protein n=1 Tax=Dinghuibacter silviterrae TaxID=1539049 RepID=A0A4R8DH83_9BACT|nr:outer membrane beta-barrel protein [Dinghuibacter silviterrae]TDW96594.1 carboxypeptidase family protein [Dinghuibacter silviterrae]